MEDNIIMIYLSKYTQTGQVGMEALAIDAVISPIL